MLRRPLAVVAAAAVALVLPAAPLAARVHVRVEGKTRTIFGPTEPVVEAGNALEALQAASFLGEFYYHLTTTSFGRYVDQVGLYPGVGSTGWVFKVDGASPPVGADQVALKDGDRVLWYFADFASGTGPRTLRLVRMGRSCYRVLAEDDTGAGVNATDAVLHVGSRRTVRTQGGIRCIGRHRGLLVRATSPGAVRSNALP